MTSPSFDKEGHPTESTLDAIRNWPIRDPFGLARFVIEAWTYDNYATLSPAPDDSEYAHAVEMELRLATGGWSGNEDLASALQGNKMFHMLYWYMSKRGGLTVYRIYELPEK